MRSCAGHSEDMKLKLAALLLALTSSLGCAATSHPTIAAPFGVARGAQSLEAVIEKPGPFTVETVTSATWEVPLSGLINLDNPRAADLKDRSEPIALFVHVLHHPTQGTFLIDSGVERAFAAHPDDALIHGVLGSLAHVDQLKTQTDMASIVEREGQPVHAVLLTHLHLDHVLGLRDVPNTVPVYVGAGDAEERSFMNLFQQGVYNDALAGKAPLREIHFAPDPDGIFEGLYDVLGDGSLWAIAMPGHTRGSIAYVARTPKGPVLLTGDACHTAWGWQHGVEPGTFSEDRAASADSLARLQRLVARHPSIDVRLGHQALPATSVR